MIADSGSIMLKLEVFFFLKVLPFLNTTAEHDVLCTTKSPQAKIETSCLLEIFFSFLTSY